MEKKQAYEMAIKDPIYKWTNTIGYIVIFVGIIMVACSYFAMMPMVNFTSGISASLFGLMMVGFSQIIKAALLYINLNKE